MVTFRSRSGRDFGYDDLASDVAAIIDQAGAERATVVGESFGGTVALWFALKFPTMLDRLVIVNSFPRFHGRLRIALAAALARWLPFRITWAARLVSNSLGLFIDGVSDESRRKFFNVMKTVDGQAYARRLQLIRGFDVEAQLARIHAPVLLIAANRDIVVPSTAEAAAMAARMPNATIRIVESAGHAVLLGDRFRLLDALEEWSGAAARENRRTVGT